MAKDNILVTGANGQLGSELRVLAAGEGEGGAGRRFFFTDIPELDITRPEETEDFVRRNGIGVIVNCAAYTQVDRAEEDETAARKVNADGPGALAAVALRTEATLIHISTDYVFDGTGCRPYREEDPTVPLGVYGRTKREGEQRVIGSGCRSVIVRTAWLYSSYGNNFVKTMLRLGRERGSVNVVCDQTGSPTYARDLAAALLHLLPRAVEKPRYGEVYHFTNQGVASWYDFAQMIFRLSGLSCTVNPVRTEDYPSKARRPFYSVLDKSRIRADFGVAVPYWVDSLRDCLALLKEKEE